MQSQQKKVKWSRGETADALEERTDTGITEVSVSKLENIVADIYGNISRRPAFKIIPQTTTEPITPVGEPGISGAFFPATPYTFVFTVNENKYIIFIAGETYIDGYLIENEKFVRKVNITGIYSNGLTYAFGKNGKASFAQSNNWGVLANVYPQTVILRLTDTDDVQIEKYQFSAPWYAPNGTETKQVTSSEITGLSFASNTLENYTFTEANGITTVYSWISTGLSASSISGTWTGNTTTFYLTAPSSSDIGYISTTPDNYIFGQWTMTNNATYSSNQTLTTIGNFNFPVKILIDSKRAYFDYAFGLATYNVTSEITLPTIPIAELIPEGSIVQFPNNGAYMRVEGYASNGTTLMMYGALLTPVANGNTTDTIVKVETGYVSLGEYEPTEFVFSQQRLFATKWQKVDFDAQTITELPGYVVGSQISRFNDFKNDYNTQSEAVVIDINTAYQEKVNYVADYNGLKIFTTASEYAYGASGVVKQSTNGSSNKCHPVVFGSALLYADKSARQIRALQYEFQTDVFQSNVINQMCQPDLIYNPVSMVPQYDKENHTGSFVYVVQEPKITLQAVTTTPAIAACNFVPGNQAEIWSRWAIPVMKYMGHDMFTIVNGVVVNNKPWFIVCGNCRNRVANQQSSLGMTFSLAELDYDNLLDFEVTAKPTDTEYAPTQNNGCPMSMLGWKASDNSVVYTERFAYDDPHTIQAGDPVYNIYGTQIGTIDTVISITQFTYNNKTYSASSSDNQTVRDLFFPFATVSVFDGNTYKWDDTLNEYGQYTKSLAGLENPRVGFMINATLESHPLDIQGKTYTEKKRIGKAMAVIRNTETGAFTVCDKTGYTAPDKKTVNFYGCTGMKDQVRYTIKNIQGAKFTIESLTMIIEYGTLDS